MPGDQLAGGPMMTLLKVALVCGLLSLANVTAVAQTKTPTCFWSGRTVGYLMVNSVAGCPFSAIVEITQTQTLGDGSHIVTRVKALSYRDTSGRIRYESTNITDPDKHAQEDLTVIEIYDPVARFSYTIMPARGTAWRSNLNAPAATIGEQPPHVSTRDPAFTKSGQEPGSKTVVENLGSRRMQGILVTGTKTTATIPIGAQGNDHELTVVKESWFSTDLGFALLRKTIDPRTYDSEMRVMSLEQSEPDPTLFQVPAGYTIVDQ
jgi:hypothetical protein